MWNLDCCVDFIGEYHDSYAPSALPEFNLLVACPSAQRCDGLPGYFLQGCALWKKLYLAL